MEVGARSGMENTGSRLEGLKGKWEYWKEGMVDLKEVKGLEVETLEVKRLEIRL
jgi:hypothetical protein